MAKLEMNKMLPLIFSVSLTPKVAQGFQFGHPLVTTNYFYWYDVESGEHMLNADGSDFLTTHPATLSSFSYKSVAWHKQQLLDMMEAGIDVLLPVTWNSPFMRLEDHFSIDGLPYLTRAWDELQSEGKSPPKIGMFYDTTTLSANALDLKVDLRSDPGKEWAFETISAFFDHIPERQRADIDGKPVVFFYNLQFAAGFDGSLVPYLQDKFLERFGRKLFLINNDRPVLERGWESGVGRQLIDQIRHGQVSPGFRSYLDHQIDLYASELSYKNAGGSDLQFVEMLYQKILLRCPDSLGRAFWINRLTENSRREVVQEFFEARETQSYESSRFLRLINGEPSIGGQSFSYIWGGALCPTLGDVASVGPGFDNKAIHWQAHIEVPRDNGTHYSQGWEQILALPQSTRPWIVNVETWNEYHEGTDISNSQEFGRQYIDITKYYSRRFHAN